MALRVGSVGLRLEAMDPAWTGSGLSGLAGLGRNRLWIGPAMLLGAVRQAINNQLRTGTDKGNPTV